MLTMPRKKWSYEPEVKDKFEKGVLKIQSIIGVRRVPVQQDIYKKELAEAYHNISLYRTGTVQTCIICKCGVGTEATACIVCQFPFHAFCAGETSISTGWTCPRCSGTKTLGTLRRDYQTKARAYLEIFRNTKPQHWPSLQSEYPQFAHVRCESDIPEFGSDLHKEDVVDGAPVGESMNMQTQFLCKFEGHSYRASAWIPRACIIANDIRYKTNYRRKMAEFLQCEAAGKLHQVNPITYVSIRPENLEIDRILTHTRGPRQLYYVSWKSCPLSESTWEEESSLLDRRADQEKLREYEESNKRPRKYPDIVSEALAELREKSREAIVNRIKERQTELIGVKTMLDKEKPTERKGDHNDSRLPDAADDVEPVLESGEKPLPFSEVKVSPDSSLDDLRSVAFRLFLATKIQALLPLEKRSLRSYQIEGIVWLVAKYTQLQSCILADEMGLGKTVQSASFLQFLYQYAGVMGPFLVLCPHSTLQHWGNEFKSWSTLRYCIYAGKQRDREIIRNYEFNVTDATGYLTFKVLKPQVVITTYELAVTDYDYLSKYPWKVAIFDEAQRLKNHRGKGYDLFMNLYLPFKVLLTGTPIQNSVDEVWSLLHFMDESKFNDLDGFMKEFGDMKDHSQVLALQQILRPRLLRRLKGNVETELKPLRETIIEVELTPIQKKLYKAIFERNVEILVGNSRKNNISLSNISMQLRKVCNHPFLIEEARSIYLAETAPLLESRRRECLAALDALDPQPTAPERYEMEMGVERQLQAGILAESSAKLKVLDKLLDKLRKGGHKVLIFSNFKIMLDIIEEFCDYRGYRHSRIDGDTLNRQALIDEFCAPNSPTFVFLLSTRAGGTGINLTPADVVIMYDSDWNPQQDLQAQARAHRIGQTKVVRMFRLLTKNTYEQFMFSAASQRLGLDKAVLQTMAQGYANESTEADASALSSRDRQEQVENLLKYGAYMAFVQSPDSSSAAEITDEEVTRIIEGSEDTEHSREIKDAAAAAAAANTFNRVMFMAEENGISLDDPEFWNKIGIPRTQPEPQGPLERSARRRQAVTIASSSSESDKESDSEYHRSESRSESSDNEPSNETHSVKSARKQVSIQAIQPTEAGYSTESIGNRKLAKKAKAANKAQTPTPPSQLTQLTLTDEHIQMQTTASLLEPTVARTLLTGEVEDGPIPDLEVAPESYGINYSLEQSKWYPALLRIFYEAVAMFGYGNWSSVRNYILCLIRRKELLDPRKVDTLPKPRDPSQGYTAEELDLPLTPSELAILTISLIKRAIYHTIQQMELHDSGTTQSVRDRFDQFVSTIIAIPWVEVLRQPEFLSDLSLIVKDDVLRALPDTPPALASDTPLPTQEEVAILRRTPEVAAPGEVGSSFLPPPYFSHPSQLRRVVCALHSAAVQFDPCFQSPVVCADFVAEMTAFTYGLDMIAMVRRLFGSPHVPPLPLLPRKAYEALRTTDSKLFSQFVEFRKASATTPQAQSKSAHIDLTADSTFADPPLSSSTTPSSTPTKGFNDANVLAGKLARLQDTLLFVSTRFNSRPIVAPAPYNARSVYTNILERNGFKVSPSGFAYVDASEPSCTRFPIGIVPLRCVSEEADRIYPMRSTRMERHPNGTLFSWTHAHDRHLLASVLYLGCERTLGEKTPNQMWLRPWSHFVLKHPDFIFHDDPYVRALYSELVQLSKARSETRVVGVSSGMVYRWRSNQEQVMKGRLLA